MIRTVMPPVSTPAALVTATARTLLGATASDDDAILELIQEATRQAEVIAAKPLVYAVYQERIVLDKPGQQWLYLQARPVSSVTSVAYGTDDALVAGTESYQYAVWPRGLYMEDGWDAGEPGWLVTYAGGYWMTPSMGASPPATAQTIDVGGLQVRRAVWEMVHATWKRDKRDPALTSLSKAGASASWATGSGLVVPAGTVGLLGGLDGAV